MTILKKLIAFVRDAWTIFGIAILMLVAVEIVLSLVIRVGSSWHSPHPASRAGADTYAGATWVASYFDEYERKLSPMRWKSYNYWRHSPFTGDYINIDSDGIRKTYNGPLPEGAAPKMKVFMFGGSTMWGTGARDDFTIPSLFAREAENNAVNCEVVNFGEHAYVSTQEVIELMLQLRKGNIPDVVIFYDGVNDIFAAFQENVAGLPQNEFDREKEFNLPRKKEVRSLAAQHAARELSITRFFHELLGRFGLGTQEAAAFIPLKYEKPITDKGILAGDVVKTYINNIELVRALSKSYGFKYLFYWQPVIYRKQRLTEYERKSIEYHNYPGMMEFHEETYAVIRKRAAEMKDISGFHDISSIFSDVNEPIYLDWSHLGEKGNSLVAQRMFVDFAGLARANGKTAEPGVVHAK